MLFLFFVLSFLVCFFVYGFFYCNAAFKNKKVIDDIFKDIKHFTI